MIVLGIVGSIAGGKTTAARYLKERHLRQWEAAWIDADLLAKRSLDHEDVKAELVLHFGEHILDTGGRMNRGKIASIVFGNDPASQAELSYLESVVHPVVRNQVLRMLKSNARDGVQVSLLDVPLLFESGWDRCCDEIWCVDADSDIRAGRALSRGWKSDEIRKREQRQLPIATKIRLSNRVILNDGSIEQLHQTLEAHYQDLGLENGKSKPGTHCR